MMARQKLVLGFAAADLILSAGLFYALAVPVAHPDPPDLSLTLKPLPSTALLPVVTPPEQAFAELAHRPLFSATRLGGVPGTGAGALPSDIHLVGIIADKEQRLALIKAAAEPLAAALRVGSTIAGWRIAAIEDDRVVLESDGNRAEIRLDANKPAKSMTPAATTSQ